jgi:hypothetical protein
MLVRCNKADDPRCVECPHSVPHQLNGLIPDWPSCDKPRCKLTGKTVRCVKVKEEKKT